MKIQIKATAHSNAERYATSVEGTVGNMIRKLVGVADLHDVLDPTSKNLTRKAADGLALALYNMGVGADTNIIMLESRIEAKYSAMIQEIHELTHTALKIALVSSSINKDLEENFHKRITQDRFQGFEMAHSFTFAERFCFFLAYDLEGLYTKRKDAWVLGLGFNQAPYDRESDFKYTIECASNDIGMPNTIRMYALINDFYEEHRH